VSTVIITWPDDPEDDAMVTLDGRYVMTCPTDEAGRCAVEGARTMAEAMGAEVRTVGEEP
jgi:hypothetical protein